MTGFKQRIAGPSGSLPQRSVKQYGHEACRHVVMGASAGGVKAFERVLGALPGDFCLPIVICQHILPGAGSDFCRVFDSVTPLAVKEADEKEYPLPGHVYFAPPGYHLLIERDGHFSLCVDEKVCYARPSIDLLFESAAQAWSPALLGVLLTGANEDGAMGIKRIKEGGGRTVVQSPRDAAQPVMPEAAIALQSVDHVLPLDGIGSFLADLQSEPARRGV